MRPPRRDRRRDRSPGEAPFPPGTDSPRAARIAARIRSGGARRTGRRARRRTSARASPPTRVPRGPGPPSGPCDTAALWVFTHLWRKHFRFGAAVQWPEGSETPELTRSLSVMLASPTWASSCRRWLRLRQRSRWWRACGHGRRRPHTWWPGAAARRLHRRGLLASAGTAARSRRLSLTGRSLPRTGRAEPPRPRAALLGFDGAPVPAQAGRLLSVSNQNGAPRDSARRLRSQRLGDPVDPSFSHHLGRENSRCVGLSLTTTRSSTMAGLPSLRVFAALRPRAEGPFVGSAVPSYRGAVSSAVGRRRFCKRCAAQRQGWGRRCRRFGRWSPHLCPPNRTCLFLSIRRIQCVEHLAGDLRLAGSALSAALGLQRRTLKPLALPRAFSYSASCSPT